VLPLPPVSGLALRASLEEARMLFDGTGCREAGGRVRIEVALPGDTPPPLVLAGTLACEGRSGTLVLAPEDPTGPLQVEATLSIEADGGYRLQSLARSDDPAVRAALMVHGFQEAAGSLSRVLEGRHAPPPLTAGRAGPVRRDGSLRSTRRHAGTVTLRVPLDDRIATIP
jgi:hypothetical protein